ncbi:MAG: glycine betaine/L-proline ABC transporter ATP-binding protein [Deltaproteobacteria bacterium]|nr:glycine betaine/L-proline ABC transporter ATP-binding protein [Deltaproteobacteria bacterium]
MSDDNPIKIRCENLWKVFGPDPKKIIEKWNTFDPKMSKTELLEKTGCVVGVREASFSITAGEIFVLMGLSGSGKSTLLRCLNRLHEPTSGKVFIDDQEITSLSVKDLRDIRRKKTGMVFQNFGLMPHRPIIENVGYGLEVQGFKRKERNSKAMEAIEMVGLKGWEQKYPVELSGGMQQRVGLARALATDPEILLMDEAFSALDPLIRRQMQDEFVKLLSNFKKTIIFVTHDLNEALKMADRIAVMKDGAITQLGSPSDIVLHPKTDYVAEFVKDLPKVKFRTANTIMKKAEGWLVGADEPASKIAKKMEKKNRFYAFLAGEDRRIKGVVNYQQLTGNGVMCEPPDEKCVSTEFPTIPADMVVENIIPIAAKTPIPIAVVDNQNRVKGVVSRKHLLEAISTKEIKE